MNKKNELLDNLIADEKKTDLSLYSAGPIWQKRARNAANKIKTCGINHFRGFDNGIATGYSDNVILDCRTGLNYGIRRIPLWLTKVFPISLIFKSQLIYTTAHYKKSLIYRQKFFSSSEKVKELLSKYSLENSTKFGCVERFLFDGMELSFQYLEILDTHDKISKVIDHKSINSFFEIGAGFGAYTHILLQNYPNIKKNYSPRYSPKSVRCHKLS